MIETYLPCETLVELSLEKKFLQFADIVGNRSSGKIDRGVEARVELYGCYVSINKIYCFAQFFNIKMKFFLKIVKPSLIYQRERYFGK